MQIALSPDAVAVLRFEIKGYRSKVPGSRLSAYRELAAAGIMEPVPGSDTEYRFTEGGMKHRAEIVERESERIERDRYESPDANISEAARERLRRHLAGERELTEENRPAYRELVAARIMIPVHSFVGGREAAYWLTYWGYTRRFELAGIACAKDDALKVDCEVESCTSEPQNGCERATDARSSSAVLAERVSVGSATYLAIALRIRLAPALRSNSVFAAAFNASS
jgi:hypothetical protein